ncbi:MAG: type II toxin-antitoxin system RelE/ParE family toxin [Thermoanaerobaculia bacterium]
MPIKSFKDKETAKVFGDDFSKKFPLAIQQRAASRLDLIDAAVDLRNLALPGLRLEALKGSRKGQHSVRINQQWRVCFTWRDGEAHDVEIVDYH